MIRKAIKDTFDNNGNLIDPHTAVGETVKLKLEETLRDHPTIILSTANPYKFPKTVFESITQEENNKNELDIQEDLEKLSKFRCPKPLTGLKEKELRHNLNCNQNEMKDMVSRILKNDSSSL